MGYGFALFNGSSAIGHIKDGHYNFVNIAYQYERPLNKTLGILAEPFASYTIDPKKGVDGGVTLSLRYHFANQDGQGFFLTFGGGAAYTSINFKEQGTHLLYIIHGGLGYRWHTFFVENRFRHYSNANSASPNRSVNANVIMVGMYF